MIGYALKPDGSWRCINTETTELDADEEFVLTQPPSTPREEA